jgi:transposase
MKERNELKHCGLRIQDHNQQSNVTIGYEIVRKISTLQQQSHPELDKAYETLREVAVQVDIDIQEKTSLIHHFHHWDD